MILAELIIILANITKKKIPISNIYLSSSSIIINTFLVKVQIKNS